MMITDSSKRVIPFRERDAKRIGEGCFYLDSIVWLNGDRIELGDNVGFNVGCFVNGFSGLVVGDGTNFGPYSMVHTANHDMEDTERPVTEQGWRDEPPVRIGRNCWVGMGAMILPGVQIGDGVVIGAGSVVVRDVEDYAVVVGNPAKHDQVAQVMRVLFLQHQPCVRAMKYAVGLRRAGRARLRLPRPHAVRALRRRRRAVREPGVRSATTRRAACRRSSRRSRPDVIHSPQPPGRADRAGRSTAPRVPVIHDVHDMQSLRADALRGRLPRARRPARARAPGGRRSAAALVTISPELVDGAGARATRCRGACVAYANYALGRDLPRELPAPRPSGRRGSSTRARCRPTAATTTCATCSPRSPRRASRSTSTWRAWCPSTARSRASASTTRCRRAALLRELVRLRLRLGGLQRRPQRRPPRHRAAQQALRVPRLRAAGDHAAAPRAAADAGRGGRGHRASTTSASWPRRWRRPTWRRCGGGWRSGAERYTVESQIARIAALYREVAGAGGGLERTATAAG